MFSVSRMIRRGASRLSFSEFGIPSEVLKLENYEESSDKDGRIRVKTLYAPINPADVNVIQGMYPLKPGSFPAVPGGEVLGLVTESSDSGFSPGDWVLSSKSASGTWRTELSGFSKDFVKIRNDIHPIGAATLKVNSATAYLMLKEFLRLREGEVIIQNGANSGVGQALIQLAKTQGLISVNLVRERPNIQALKDELFSLGADYVLTAPELKTTKLFSSISKPRLALNCVGGDFSTLIAKTLSSGGVHVTYGGMSFRPVLAPTSNLIFKDITYKGFWLTRWYGNKTYEETQEVLNYLSNLVFEGKLIPPKYKLVGLKDYKEAVSLEGFRNVKYIFDMNRE